MTVGELKSQLGSVPDTAVIVVVADEWAGGYRPAHVDLKTAVQKSETLFDDPTERDTVVKVILAFT